MVIQSRNTKAGVFPSTLHTTVFVFQIEFVKGQMPFLMPKTGRNQQGVCSLQSAVSPQQVQGRALVGDKEVKHREAQCFWALRISYFSLKSIIFCESLHNLRIPQPIRGTFYLCIYMFCLGQKDFFQGQKDCNKEKKFLIIN